MAVVSPGLKRQHRVQLFPMPYAPQHVAIPFVRRPVRPAHDATQRIPGLVAVDGDGDPPVIAGARVASVGRHGRVFVAQAFLNSPVDRPVQQRLRDGRAASLRLRHVDELALPGIETVHQRQHHGSDGVFSRRVVGVGDLRHHRPAFLVARHVGQTRRAFGGRPGRAEVRPRPVKPVAGGRHHDYVGANLAQVVVLQPEVTDHSRREVLGEHVGYCDQVAQHFPPLVAAQVQRQPQLVAVLLVEVGPPIPEIPVHVVVVQRVGPVAFQPLHRFQADDFRAHVGQPLHRRRYGDQLPHLDDAYALQRSRHVR